MGQVLFAQTFLQLVPSKGALNVKFSTDCVIPMPREQSTLVKCCTASYECCRGAGMRVPYDGLISRPHSHRRRARAGHETNHMIHQLSSLLD